MNYLSIVLFVFSTEVVQKSYQNTSYLYVRRLLTNQFSAKANFYFSDIQSETGKFCRILLDAIDFPFRKKLCVRWASMIHPDILTLPGTVGRGFMAHGYLCVICKYPKTKVEFFIMRNSNRKKPQSGFFTAWKPRRVILKM